MAAKPGAAPLIGPLLDGTSQELYRQATKVLKENKKHF
jgi:hypothetical protein